jgi:hypothetical protein
MIRAKSVTIFVTAVAIYSPLRLMQDPVVMVESQAFSTGLQAKTNANIMAMLYPTIIAEIK